MTPSERALIKHQHQQLRRRGYVVDNKLRNIWYNEQCLRPGSTPRGIAQELDRDPRGSVAKVFNGEIVREARERCVRAPVQQGRLVVDMEQAVVREPWLVTQADGELSLWVRVGLDGEVPVSMYAIGVDVSAGTAGDFSSNSVAFVIDRMTGQQVAEWVANNFTQQRFACVVAALARWFHNALVIPEANFASAFMKSLNDDYHYYNVWRRQTEVTGFKKMQKNLGFWIKDDDTKLRLFETLQAAMADQAFLPRSKSLLDEMPEYEWRNGRIIHIGSTKTEDESAKGRAHGDRVIAASLAWHVCDQLPLKTGDNDERDVLIPPGSMAARLKEYDELQRGTDDPWGLPELDPFVGVKVTFTDPWA